MSSSSSLTVKPTSTSSITEAILNQNEEEWQPIQAPINIPTDTITTEDGPIYRTSDSNSYKGEFFKMYYNTISTLNKAVATRLTDDKLKDNVETWVLGDRYKGLDTNAWVSDKVSAVSYFTYRNRFPQQLPNGVDHDAGWGCMLRTGQSMISEAVRRIMKCKFNPQVPETNKTEKELDKKNDEMDLNKKNQANLKKESSNIPLKLSVNATDLPLIYGLDQKGSERAHAVSSLFYDSPMSPFGIHNLTWTGVSAAKVDIGEWFTPTALARTITAIWSDGRLFPDTGTPRKEVSDICGSNINRLTGEISSTKSCNTVANDKGARSRHRSRGSFDNLIAVVPDGFGADPIPSDLNSNPSSKTKIATGDDAATYIHELFNRLRERIAVITAYDGAVCREEVLNVLNTPVQPYMASHMKDIANTTSPTADHILKGKRDNKSVLLLVPLMLGYGAIPTESYEVVLKVLELSSSLGIVGGKPRESFYFVGHQEEQLFYFDPHVVQEAFINPQTIGICSGTRSTTSISNVDPCMLLGFLFESQKDYEVFEKYFSEIPPLSVSHLISFISTIEEKNRKEENLLETKASLSEMEFSSDEN
eukprot:Tbor_TRINITY_DN7603_c0_g1::TRINITY_DN7603_c0_g1_i1::g.975::m.975